MKSSKFSVVVPSYNLGALLLRTVQSILDQTLDSVEVIVVDDASSDQDTINVLNDLKQNSEVTVHILKENIGVAAVRNYGIKLTTANYVLCLDSDDYIEKNYLQKAYEVFENQADIGIVYTWYKVFGDNQGVWKYSSNFTLIDLIIENRLPSGSCVRKKIYEEVGYYDENRCLSGMDDWDLWIRVFFETSWKPYVIQEPLFNYHIRMNSQQHSASDLKVYRSIKVIQEKNRQFLHDYSSEIYLKLQEKIHKLRFASKKHALQKANVILKMKECIERKNITINDLENQISKTKFEIHDLKMKNSRLRTSKSFRIGDLFLRSIKKPYKLLSFPINLLNILIK